MPGDGCGAERDWPLHRACGKAWAQQIPMPHAPRRDIIVIAAFDTSKMAHAPAMQNGPGEARGRL